MCQLCALHCIADSYGSLGLTRINHYARFHGKRRTAIYAIQFYVLPYPLGFDHRSLYQNHKKFEAIKTCHWWAGPSAEYDKNKKSQTKPEYYEGLRINCRGLFRLLDFNYYKITCSGLPIAGQRLLFAPTGFVILHTAIFTSGNQPHNTFRVEHKFPYCFEGNVQSFFVHKVVDERLSLNLIWWWTIKEWGLYFSNKIKFERKLLNKIDRTFKLH